MHFQNLSQTTQKYTIFPTNEKLNQIYSNQIYFPSLSETLSILINSLLINKNIPLIHKYLNNTFSINNEWKTMISCRILGWNAYNFPHVSKIQLHDGARCNKVESSLAGQRVRLCSFTCAFSQPWSVHMGLHWYTARKCGSECYLRLRRRVKASVYTPTLAFNKLI